VRIHAPRRRVHLEDLVAIVLDESGRAGKRRHFRIVRRLAPARAAHRVAAAVGHDGVRRCAGVVDDDDVVAGVGEVKRPRGDRRGERWLRHDLEGHERPVARYFRVAELTARRIVVSASAGREQGERESDDREHS
jgi:hypothetical protein